MKKFIFLSIFALGLGMTSCDDFEYPNPPAQSNPQEEVYDAANLKVDAITSPINLETANAANATVKLAVLTSAEGLPEGYNPFFQAYMSASEDFADAKAFATFFDGTTVYSKPDAMDAVYHEVMGTIDPNAKTVYIRLAAYAYNEKGSVKQYRLGGTDTYFGTMSTSVTPFAPDFVVEDSYYLIYSSDAETWTKDNSIPFTHSDASPYDDPNFSLMCNFSAAQLGEGLYWKVIPETTYASFDLANGVVIGVVEADSESRSGKLDDSADQLAGWFDLDGMAEFKINMKDLTFSYRTAIENFWLAGNDVNGLSWTFADDPTMFTFDYVHYAGVANLDAEFKFSPTNGWKGDFGSDGGLVLKDKDGQVYAEGKATGGGNINVPEPGFYFISLNYSTKDLSLLKVESMGIIGGFNSWSESVDMTASEDNFVYTLTADLNEGDEWKFRANGQWTFSLGGDFDNLSPFNGANFKCNETGTYDIRLDLSQLPWTATVVKK